MALVTNFTERIEDLAGSTTSIADANALEQWVSDGAQDVSERVKTLKPNIIGRFTSRVAGNFSSAIDITEYGEIISVDVGNKEAREVHFRFRHHLGLVDSIHYASSEDPAYYIHNTHLSMMPASGTGYIHHIPANYSINMTAGTIADFPAEFYRYVIIYAALKVLNRKMVDFNSNLPSLSFPVTVPDITIESLDITDLSVSLSVPVVPADLQDIDVAGIPTPDVSSDLPTFNKPTTVPNFADIDNWINTEEDAELAGARIGSVGAQLQQYATDIQNEVNKFNKENAIYQAKIQANMQKFNSDVQNAGKEADLEVQVYQANLAKFQADLSAFSASLNKEVNVWQQNMQKDLQIWTTKLSNELQKFTINVQKYNAEVQSETGRFAAELQKDTTEYQWLTTQYASLKAEYNEAFGIGV